KTQRAKGGRFERFVRRYLEVDPYWADRLDEVWAWDEWPGRGAMPDTGIDLVARERGTGRLIAVQCKFYRPGATLTWEQVGTFVGMLANPVFDEGLIVSTAG